MSMIAVLVTSSCLSCYRREGSQWRPLPIAGEAVSPLSDRAERHIDAIRDELHDAASIAAAHLCLLVDDAATAQAHAAGLLASGLAARIGRIDAQRLAPLVEGARARQAGSPAQAQWCIDYLLPQLDAPDGAAAADSGASAALQARLDIAEHENREMAERLGALQGRLEQLNAAHREERNALHARMAALATPPVEELVRYMPLFFRQFWEKLSPADLAHVLRISEIPVVPSPFPEPSGAALAAMRRQFGGLPEPVRQAVLALARDLAVNWDVRPDMLDLFEGA